MAGKLKIIAEEAVRKAEKSTKKIAKKSRPKVLNPKPRSSDPIDSNSSSNKQQDFLMLLKTELRAPFLGLVEEYVKRCSPRNRNIESSMYIFKEKHRFLYGLCFLLDSLLWVVFISTVIFIALRGLGIIQI